MKHYTKKELAEMAEMFNQGATYKEIAEMMGRTEKAIGEKLRQMGVGRRTAEGPAEVEAETETIEVEGKTLVKMKTLDDYPARDLIKNLYDRGYRIENNKLYYIHKKEVNIADCCR